MPSHIYDCKKTGLPLISSLFLHFHFFSCSLISIFHFTFYHPSLPTFHPFARPSYSHVLLLPYRSMLVMPLFTISTSEVTALLHYTKLFVVSIIIV